MRRIAVLIAVGAVALTVLATWGGVASAREAESSTAAEAKQRQLPPLPANIRQRGRFNMGIKCDAPPFGYIDVRGQHAGFEIEMARWFSRFAFGKPTRVNFTCLTTPAREPALTSDRVDFVLATFTYTADRDTRIDFSRPYYRATGRLLVSNSAPDSYLSQLGGKTISTTTGSIYDRWMRNCFRNTRVLALDSLTSAVLAFRDGRADAVMWDDTVLVGVAAQDRNVKLTNDKFLEGPYGIGIKQGNVALKRWIDSRLNIMKRRDTFNSLLRNYIPARVIASFRGNILRPNNNFRYATGDVTTQCP